MTYVMNNQTIDKQTLKEEVEDLSSYIHEANFLTSQYEQKKITFIYTRIQSQYLAKKTTNFVDVLTKKDVPKKYDKDVADISIISIKLESVFTKLSSSHGDTEALKNTKNKLVTLQKEIKKLSKNYE